jgi:5-hydroxyisourate hydrolase-like protein (transthyretin family)
MRVSSPVERLDVAPGGTGVVSLVVANTSEVIDSASVHAIGVPAGAVRSEPASLALFPEATGELTLTFALPAAFPAGSYPVTLVVAGEAAGTGEAYHELDLVVPPQPMLRVAATPTAVRTRWRALFTVEVHNEGNTPLDVALSTVQQDQRVRTSLAPSTLSIPVGGTGTSTVAVRGPRQLLGADRDRPLTVVAGGGGTDGQVALVLKQRSLISTGLLTALVLMSIVAAWALAVLLGMRQVLGGDPFTKVAPASFFAATATNASATTGAGAAPAGALAKGGTLPAGVGGTLTGVVKGAADGQGVARLTVDAWRLGKDGLVEVSSAATQSDGRYTLAGLFPGTYYLQVAADGYDKVWYPSAPTQAAAAGVTAVSQQVTDGKDIVVTGHPASIDGKVDVGDATKTVTVQVTATPAWPGADPKAHYVTTADPASGAYTFATLPAPGTYQLSFVAPGYQPTTTTERILGGQQRFALDARLSAGPGQIAGTVTDGSAPLGGVTVSTTVAGQPFTVGTPTLGQVGAFVLPNLPTPGTYVLTFAKPGFGSRTIVVALGAGEQRTGLTQSLAGGTGTVTGTVVDASGAGLGGVAVTAGTGAAAATTTTLTAGSVGAFTLAGITGQGSVTLTFSKAGYATVAVPVTLSPDAAPAPLHVTMVSATGSVTGRVTRNGVGTVGLTVAATNGATTQTTTTTASGAFGAGTYLLPGLPAGIWTVTVTGTPGGPVLATAVVTVGRGTTVTADLPVGG